MESCFISGSFELFVLLAQSSELYLDIIIILHTTDEVLELLKSEELVGQRHSLPFRTVGAGV